MAGNPDATGRLKEILDDLSERHQKAADALWTHLLGGTSADWLSDVLTRHGYSIGATTIKTQRRRWKESA